MSDKSKTKRKHLSKSTSVTIPPPTSNIPEPLPVPTAAVMDRIRPIADKITRDLNAPRFTKNEAGQVVPEFKDGLSQFVSMAEATGTTSQALANLIDGQLAGLPKDQNVTVRTAAMGFLHEHAPKDSIEGMLLATMFKANYLAGQFATRALKLDDPELIDANVNRTVRLSRLFAEQLEALQKYRGKGDQRIEVQHVHVNTGGQAVIGNVQGGGLDGKKA